MYGLTSKWIRLCLLRWLGWRNTLLQMSQLYDIRPSWSRLWFINALSLLYVILHRSQANARLSPRMRFCLDTLPDRADRSSQLLSCNSSASGTSDRTFDEAGCCSKSVTSSAGATCQTKPTSGIWRSCGTICEYSFASWKHRNKSVIRFGRRNTNNMCAKQPLLNNKYMLCNTCAHNTFNKHKSRCILT